MLMGITVSVIIEIFKIKQQRPIISETKEYESENCRPVIGTCHINSKLLDLKCTPAHPEHRRTWELKSKQIQDFCIVHTIENKKRWWEEDAHL